MCPYALLPQGARVSGEAGSDLILKKLVALRPPTDWSSAILTFVRLFCPPWEGRFWDARDALQFIASSGGRLTSVPADELRFLRRGMLDLTQADDFLPPVSWLTNEKQYAPAA